MESAILVSKGNSVTSRNVQTWNKTKAKRDKRAVAVKVVPKIDPKYLPRKVKRTA